MLRQIEKTNNVINLLDIAFWLFKKDFRSYLRLIMVIFSFFSLIVFVILIGEISTQRPPFVSFVWLITGGTPPGSIQPLAAVLREIALFDGSVPWIITSAAFATHITDNKSPKSLQYRKLIYFNITLLSILVGLLMIILKLMGLNLLSDIVRFPTVIIPYVIVVEHENVIRSLKKVLHLCQKIS